MGKVYKSNLPRPEITHLCLNIVSCNYVAHCSKGRGDYTLRGGGQVFINQAAKEKTEEQRWQTVEEDDVSYLLVVHQKLNDPATNPVIDHRLNLVVGA